MTPETKWSIEWWKQRHENIYFPVMDWHKDWKVCPYPPPHVVERINPNTRDTGLEIGCGYGEWMVPLAKTTGCKLYGIDISHILRDKARETFLTNKVDDRCRFVPCNGYSIPFENETFDFIYSISVFQHIPRSTVQAYFQESDRVLKPGGRVLFHFRRDDGQGEYSYDIYVNHRGDFSTGWTAAEVTTETVKVGWVNQSIWGDESHSLYLYAEKPTYEIAKQAS